MNPDHEAFQAAARHGVLPIQRCAECGHVQFALAGRSAAVGRCRRCRSLHPPWVASDGAATLVSYTVVPTGPRDAEPSPARVAGIAELVEGPWVHGRIEADPSDLVVGMPLRATVSDVKAGKDVVPVFRLDHRIPNL